MMHHRGMPAPMIGMGPPRVLFPVGAGGLQTLQPIVTGPGGLGGAGGQMSPSPGGMMMPGYMMSGGVDGLNGMGGPHNMSGVIMPGGAHMIGGMGGTQHMMGGMVGPHVTDAVMSGGMMGGMMNNGMGGGGVMSGSVETNNVMGGGVISGNGGGGAAMTNSNGMNDSMGGAHAASHGMYSQGSSMVGDGPIRSSSTSTTRTTTISNTSSIHNRCGWNTTSSRGNARTPRPRYRADRTRGTAA